MFFKGASQCCTPVSVKGPGLCRLLLALSVRVCVCVHLKLTVTPPVLTRCCGCRRLHVCLLVFPLLFHIICLPFTDDPRLHARAGEL